MSAHKYDSCGKYLGRFCSIHLLAASPREVGRHKQGMLGGVGGGGGGQGAEDDVGCCACLPGTQKPANAVSLHSLHPHCCNCSCCKPGYLHSVAQGQGHPLPKDLQRFSVGCCADCGAAYTKDYTLKSGDTTFNIASSCGVPLECLVSNNPAIPNPASVMAGQHIKIPSSCSLSSSASVAPASSSSSGRALKLLKYPSLQQFL